MLTNSPLLINTTSIDVSHLPISTFHFPMAAGVALNVIGMWLVRLFHQNNAGVFYPVAFEMPTVFHLLPQPLETRKGNTFDQ
jgi:hypothetical protein